jgi:hypothetical protein
LTDVLEFSKPTCGVKESFWAFIASAETMNRPDKATLLMAINFSVEKLR